MILLLGGTSETAPIALALAQKGYPVLVSTATDAELDVGDHPLISRRMGRLDAEGLCEVIEASSIRAIVDATHPYATAAKATAREVAQALNIPLFVFVRPGVVGEAVSTTDGFAERGTAPRYALRATRGNGPSSVEDTGEEGQYATDRPPAESKTTKGRLPRVVPGTGTYRGAGQRISHRQAHIVQAPDHEEAARIAFYYGTPVLLTTGSRNLEPYVREANKTGIRLVARVLDHPESLDACAGAGIECGNIILGRGPYSVEENCSAIREFGIGVLVTKDSGSAGGVEEKLEAARLEGCRVVVVRRPDSDTASYVTIDELVSAIAAAHLRKKRTG